MKPLITIGVAVYNIDKESLTECIESIVSNRSGSFEIIIVNDCSTNGCDAVCKKYASADSRIEYVEFAKNHGIGYVRNAIIERARGEWIFFVDGDDKIYSNFEDSVRSEHTSGCDILIYDYESFTEEQLYNCSFYDGKYELLSQKEIERCCIACLTEAPCFIKGKSLSKGCTAKGYRKDFLIKNNIRFVEELKISEDSMFYADALHRCSKAVYIFPLLCTTTAAATSSRLQTTTIPTRQSSEAFISYLPAKESPIIFPAEMTLKSFITPTKLLLSLLWNVS